MSQNSKNPSFEQAWNQSGLAPLEGIHSPEQTITVREGNPAATAHSIDLEGSSPQAETKQHSRVTLPFINMRSRVQMPEDWGEPVPDPSNTLDLEIVGVLGEGGMGFVHLAEQRALHRKVAVKQIKPEVYNEATADRLLEEAWITGSLEHPNIIPIYWLGRDNDNQPLLIMRKVEGVTWDILIDDPNHELWDKRKTWTDDPIIRNIEILMELCNAIHFAHNQHILHRDIKPENVMIGEFGEIYILDWGIAKRLNDPADATGEKDHKVSGTPAFMAPEMMSKDPSKLSPRSDVYLLGATLHYILTGQFRHLGGSLYETMFSVMQSDPFPYKEAIPVELAAIANKAMHKDPERRYPTALAFREALATFLSHFNSLELSNLAVERLEQLRQLIPQAQQGSGSHLPQIIRRLFTECRYGFTQSLRTWKGNPKARKGQQECLELMIGFEVGQHNLDVATSLLGELPSPNPELSALAQQLQETLHREREESERLQQQARDMDLRVGVAQRIRTLLLLTVCIGMSGVGTLVLVRTGKIVLNYPMLIAMVVVGLGLQAVAMWRWRDPLWTHKANRNFLGFVAIGMTGMLFARLVGYRFGIPIAQELLFEFTLFALILSSAAILFHPMFWSGVLVAVLNFGFGLAFPTWIYEAMVFMCFFMWCMPIFVFWKTARKNVEGSTQVKQSR